MKKTSIKIFLVTFFATFLFFTQNIELVKADLVSDIKECEARGKSWNTIEEICDETSNTAASSTAPKAVECTLGNMLNPLSGSNCSFKTFLINILDWALVGLAAQFAAMAGGFLDIILRLTVINFRDVVEGTGALNSTTSGIYGIWVFIKSIINIVIVFELLFLSIQMIIGKGGFSWRARLMQVLTFAVFTNFSFYFTKVLIDLSNIVTVQIYGAMYQGGDGGISNAFMSVLNPQVDANNFSQANGSLLDPILKAGLILVICFVFVQIALVFLTRAVTFFFLLVLSPLMFASWAGVGALGFVKNWGTKWWGTFQKQLFVGPLTMLMLYLALRMMSSDVFALFLNTGKNFSEVKGVGGLAVYGATNALDIAKVLLKYAVYLAVITGALKIANSFSTSASDKVGSFINKGFGKVAGGVGGAIGRQTLGRLSKAAGGRWAEGLRNGAAKGGVAGFAARRGLDLIDTGKTSSFDFRNADNMVTKGLAKAGVSSPKGGFGAGSGKGGISQLIKESEESKGKKIEAKVKYTQTDTSKMSTETPEDKEKKRQAEADNAARKSSILQAETYKSGAQTISQKADIEKTRKEIEKLEEQKAQATAVIEQNKGKTDDESLKKIAKANVTIVQAAAKIEKHETDIKKAASTSMLKAGLSAVTNLTKTGTMTGGKSYGEVAAVALDKANKEESKLLEKQKSEKKKEADAKFKKDSDKLAKTLMETMSVITKPDGTYAGAKMSMSDNKKEIDKQIKDIELQLKDGLMVSLDAQGKEIVDDFGNKVLKPIDEKSRTDMNAKKVMLRHTSNNHKRLWNDIHGDGDKTEKTETDKGGEKTDDKK